MEELTSQIQGMFQNIGGNTKKQSKKVTVKEAMKILTQEESSKLINEENIRVKALENVEQNGSFLLMKLIKFVLDKRCLVKFQDKVFKETYFH